MYRCLTWFLLGLEKSGNLVGQGKVREFWPESGKMVWVREKSREIGLSQGKVRENLTSASECPQMPLFSSIFFKICWGESPRPPSFTVLYYVYKDLSVSQDSKHWFFFCSLRWAILLILFNVIFYYAGLKLVNHWDFLFLWINVVGRVWNTARFIGQNPNSRLQHLFKWWVSLGLLHMQIYHRNCFVGTII